MNQLGQKATYYDILELATDATPQEVREAYLKLKSAYARDSLALYTLISPEETEKLLLEIEQAYQILSNPDRRKDYDRNHGVELPNNSQARAPEDAVADMTKVISIDRVPPMESGATDELLNPPNTDFTGKQALAPQARSTDPQTSTSADGDSHFEKNTEGLKSQIDMESDWRGGFLKKIREAQGISVEELAEYTKISKTYIRAIEEEDYTKLPAAVYLRGFVHQLARKLKLPAEKVATAYVARYRDACPSKT